MVNARLLISNIPPSFWSETLVITNSICIGF